MTEMRSSPMIRWVALAALVPALGACGVRACKASAECGEGELCAPDSDDSRSRFCCDADDLCNGHCCGGAQVCQDGACVNVSTDEGDDGPAPVADGYGSGYDDSDCGSDCDVPPAEDTSTGGDDWTDDWSDDSGSTTGDDSSTGDDGSSDDGSGGGDSLRQGGKRHHPRS